MINNTYLIAEIGINHNGDINIAKQLIDNAKNSKFIKLKHSKKRESQDQKYKCHVCQQLTFFGILRVFWI